MVSAKRELGLILFFFLSCNSSPISQVEKQWDKATLRQSLVTEASKYKGKPYKAAGKSPQGFDCSGFTSYVFHQFDIELSASSTTQAQQGKEVALEEAEVGDLVFFGRNGRTGKLMHVGIISKNSEEGLFMWHSSSSKGVIETNISQSEYWKPKLLYVRTVL